MNIRLLALGCAAAAVLPVMGFEDLGPLADARVKYPFLFVPQSVNTVEINAHPHYVFNGQSERLIDDETDSELWDEATLAAKAVFLENKAEGDASVKVSFSGCSPLYRVKEGKVFTMVLAVPVDKVKVERKKVAVVAPAVAEPGTEQKKEAPAPAAESTPAAEPAPIAEAAPAPEEKVAPSVPPPVTKEEKDELGELRDYVATHPADWRKRRRLSDLYFAIGKNGRATRHLALVVRSAIAEDQSGEEFFELLASSAKTFEEAGMDAMALKCSRILQHKPVPFSLKKEATSRINRLLMRMK